MTFNVDQLIGYQLAEFAQCSQRRVHLLAAQSTIAAAAIASVYFEGPKASYLMGFMGLVLVIAWFVLLLRYRGSRDVAERARRATLIMGGLGQTISSSELIDIQNSFTIKDEAARQRFDPDYFASKSAPGFDRLAEMLEESSFWTKELQAGSARYMGAFAALLFLLSIFLVFAAIMFVDGPHLMQIVRVAFVILTTTVFSSVLDTAMAHYRTANAVARIHHRLEVAKSKGNPKADLLLLLSDYNAVVESAPLNLPYVYASRKEKFNRLWQQRQALDNPPQNPEEQSTA